MKADFSEAAHGQIRENGVHLTKRQKRYLIFKRCMDLIGASVGLVILLPVFLAVAAAIKAEEPVERVLFSQSRIGRSGKPFRVYKFRSMRTGAPELSTREFSDADRYITTVGRWIRKTSLDELPQLWNVLTGNMSLIGPRPLLARERSVHVARFSCGLYQVRPGITGLAQTHGRDKMSDREKVYWDAKYVRNLSFSLDVRLFLETFAQVVLRRKAEERDMLSGNVCLEESLSPEDSRGSSAGLKSGIYLR